MEKQQNAFEYQIQGNETHQNYSAKELSVSTPLFPPLHFYPSVSLLETPQMCLQVIASAPSPSATCSEELFFMLRGWCPGFSL